MVVVLIHVQCGCDQIIAAIKKRGQSWPKRSLGETGAAEDLGLPASNTTRHGISKILVQQLFQP